MYISPNDPLRLLIWQHFGAELRRMRESAGLTQAELASLVFVSASYIAQFEAGRRKPMTDVARRLDEALKSDGTLLRIVTKLVTPEIAEPSFILPYLEMEREAISCHVYESVRLPGILQTRQYAEAIFRAYRPHAPAADEEITELTDTRVRRRDLLSPPSNLRLWVVLHEAALHAPVGGPKTMHEQLLDLIDVIQSHRVVLQVLPFSAGEVGVMLSPFSLLRFEDLPSVLHTEALGNGILRDEAELTEHAYEVFAQLRGAALSPSASLEYLQSLAQGSQDYYSPRQLG
ncbi:helix-turn-helix transcriptional regulator [Streptomyces sp. NPDC047046]|uniref:helix-turn-helix domain-containing protein n=1 Tax=Streptomyces sp. NPDC047046 TaxID=3155378 RepID=UPI0033CBDE9A